MDTSTNERAVAITVHYGATSGCGRASGDVPMWVTAED